MKTVVIESPLAGDVERNTAYAELALLDCIEKGEAPFASHLLFPQVLDDTDRAQLQQGMLAGFAIGKRLEACAVYVDLGISSGMRSGITRHRNHGLTVEERRIDDFEEKIAARLRAKAARR